MTIKTFAHHLRRALPSGGDEEQVARLTGEAVAQIDQTLENLLEFTRLETPVRAVGAALGRARSGARTSARRRSARRGVALDHPPAPPVAVRGDPQQLAYALGNLVRALTRDLAPASRLAVRYGAPADAHHRAAAAAPIRSAAISPRCSTAPSDGSPPLPLGVAIANAVLERNGAQVALADDDPFDGHRPLHARRTMTPWVPEMEQSPRTDR